MSPRRLSKRQKERIENIQERRRARATARAEAAISQAEAQPGEGVVWESCWPTSIMTATSTYITV